MSLVVDLGDLVASGVAVSGVGEDVAAAHQTADGRIESALPGWRGASAVAMAALAGEWASSTHALLVRLSDHAAALHASAAAFDRHEQQAASTLDALH